MFIGWLEILSVLYVPRWEKRKEHVKCCIKNCTETSYVANNPLLDIFSPQTSHKCSCSHPLHIHDSNHNHPLMSYLWYPSGCYCQSYSTSFQNLILTIWTLCYHSAMYWHPTYMVLMSAVIVNVWCTISTATVSSNGMYKGSYLTLLSEAALERKLPSISKSSMWANIPMFHSQSSVLSLHSGYHDDIVWTDMYPVSHGANAKYVWTLVPAVVGSAVCLVRWAPQGPVWNVRR